VPSRADAVRIRFYSPYTRHDAIALPAN
jgi:hypothetical protein